MSVYSRKDLRSYRRIRVYKDPDVGHGPWQVAFWHPVYDQPCIYSFYGWETAMSLVRIVVAAWTARRLLEDGTWSTTPSS